MEPCLVHRSRIAGPFVSTLVALTFLSHLTLLPNSLLTGSEQKISGYAEYRHGHVLIVDGQRVVADQATEFKAKGLKSLDQIPLGFEVKVEGRRVNDGAIVATKLEAKPNGTAFFEQATERAANQMEAGLLAAGKVTLGPGFTAEIGASGSEQERATLILRKLMPPYLTPSLLRVYILNSSEWNAFAMPNGAIWINRGVLTDCDDDELAIVLAHELAHFTHEHARRQEKKGMWIRLAALAAALGLERIGPGTAATYLRKAGDLLLSAWENGYSRECEDQADRVGLRYAYEAGFNVAKGPAMWQRVLARYGDQDAVTNFFWGGHSLSAKRAEHLEDEIRINYSGEAQTSFAGMTRPELRHPPGTPSSTKPSISASLTGDYSWWKSADESDDPESQFEMGVAYATGEGATKNNKAAVDYFKRAAKQGYMDAQLALAEIYLNGRLGIATNPQEGLRWYVSAAKQGDAEVEAELGDVYYFGRGVSVDYLEALRWYRKAADAGLGRAQFNVGAMYIKGQGVERDFQEARKWMEAASKSQDVRERAQEVLRQLEEAGNYPK